MALKGNVSGTWKDYVAWVNVAGTWKKAAVWQNVAGTWKQITSLLAATLSNATYIHTTVSPANATAGFRLDNDFSADSLAGAAYTERYTWKTGSGAAADYEARWTTISGSLSSGTAGTWLGLGTDRVWTRTRTADGIGSDTVVGTVEIREAAAPNTVLATATITLTASVDI